MSAPAVRIPRRLANMIRQSPPSATGTRNGTSNGTAEVAVSTPEATDTAQHFFGAVDGRGDGIGAQNRQRGQPTQALAALPAARERRAKQDSFEMVPGARQPPVRRRVRRNRVDPGCDR